MSRRWNEETAWNKVGDDDLHGVPAYDVDQVARRIVACCSADPARVLDLGCGRGRLTNHLARHLPEWSIHGVDISRTQIDRAKRDASDLPNVHYWRGDGRTLPPGLGARQYDLAYSVTMFQHIPHDAKWGYIREVEKRLKPGGVFVFTIAVGDEDMFLNHQIANTADFSVELDKVFVLAEFDQNDPNGWTWVTTEKRQ